VLRNDVLHGQRLAGDLQVAGRLPVGRRKKSTPSNVGAVVRRGDAVDGFEARRSRAGATPSLCKGWGVGDDGGVMRRSAHPLGRLLLDTGVITQVQLDEVLVWQRTDRRRLGELLVERGLVNPLELAQLLSHQLSCPWISLAQLDIDPEVLAMLPDELAMDHGVIPVYRRHSKGQHVLYIATDDPTDDVALAECSAAARMPVRPMVAISGEVRSALTRLYGMDEPAPGRRPAAPAAPKLRPAPSPRAAAPAADVVELAPDPAAKRAPTILVLNAPEKFLAECRVAVASLGATLVDGSIVRAGDLVTEHRPCAIVVTDDVYAFDRSGLNRLALDNDAHLVVWSEEVDSRQLEPLLAGAIDRWGRSSYEKGAIIDGRYELLRDLGAPSTGGPARWEVRNARTARRSVLLLAVRAEGEEHVTAVRNEQKALARVVHPGAIELRDAGTTELGDPYVVVEQLEGRSLDGLVAAKAKLPRDEVCALIVQVADVLAAAHAAGVVHRNVVAENIVVTRDGYGLEQVKLVGWGRATVSDPTTVAPREDLIALAACAFEALTGRTPNRGAIAGGEVPETLLPLLSRALTGEETALASARDLAVAFRRASSHGRERTQLLEASPESRAATDDAEAGAPTQPSPEQRRWARAPYRTPVRIEVPGIGAIDGRSEDISGGGLLVVSRAGLKAGTEVTVRFALPLDGRIVAEPAVIKWLRTARPGESALCAIGVELTAVSAEALRQIERYASLMGDGSEASFAK
jgi:Type II secretion system (T2SS), protein E, N-terminal domain/Protein kinase domain/PilZ domain